MTYAEQKEFNPKTSDSKLVDSILENVKNREVLKSEALEHFIKRLPINERIKYSMGKTGNGVKKRKKEFINNYVNERLNVGTSLVKKCLKGLESYSVHKNKMNQFEKAIHWYLLDNNIITYEKSVWGIKPFDKKSVITGVIREYADYLKQ